MSDDLLFQEVDEELRREKYRQLWQRWGTYFVAACFGIIAVVAGYKGWQYWELRQAEQSGRAYIDVINLLEDDKREEARSALTHLIENGSRGVQLLARLQEAGLLAEDGKTQEAQAAFDAIAGDAGADRPIRDFARIRSAYLQVDNASFEALSTYLNGLDAPTSPWRSSAREILALAAFRESDFLQADRLLNLILADPAAPNGTRQRAAILLELVKPKLNSSASSS